MCWGGGRGGGRVRANFDSRGERIGRHMRLWLEEKGLERDGKMVSG
jgi:hypothetical protein